ncbi:MAG: glycosyltransferase, partial [Sandaracinaceae bacterium]
QLLPEAALVVTHCGHGTSIKALAAGLPAVCIPMGRDQNDNAARIVHLGAGVRLAPSASARKIRAAVRRVLAEPRFRAAAARVATTLADEATRLDPVRELEALVDGHAARRELRA